MLRIASSLSLSTPPAAPDATQASSKGGYPSVSCFAMPCLLMSSRLSPSLTHAAAPHATHASSKGVGLCLSLAADHRVMVPHSAVHLYTCANPQAHSAGASGDRGQRGGVCGVQPVDRRHRAQLHPGPPAGGELERERGGAGVWDTGGK
ncbi:unnamed protein product [Closterium sp. NIES-54]